MKRCDTCNSLAGDHLNFCENDGRPLVPDQFATILQEALDEKYTLTELIGKGSMGAVYRARHRELDDVAIKVMLGPPENRQLSQRFLREARALRRLRHQHAVLIYDLERHEHTGLTYMVMEMVEGGSLRQELQERKRFTVVEAVEIAEAVCSALQAAHERGIIHRDLKPDNILMAEEESVSGQNLRTIKIADFGIVKLRGTEEGGEEASMQLTQNGVPVGTPFYMSPEQWFGDGPGLTALDGRTDLYALGCTLYELLSGRVPFLAETTKEMRRMHLQQDPVPLHDIAPQVPVPVSRVIMRALEKDREDRPQTALEFASELRKAYQQSFQETDNLTRNRLNTDQAAFIAPPEPPPAPQVASDQPFHDQSQMAPTGKPYDTAPSDFEAGRADETPTVLRRVADLNLPGPAPTEPDSPPAPAEAAGPQPPPQQPPPQSQPELPDSPESTMPSASRRDEEETVMRRLADPTAWPTFQPGPLPPETNQAPQQPPQQRPPNQPVPPPLQQQYVPQEQMPPQQYPPQGAPPYAPQPQYPQYQPQYGGAPRPAPLAGRKGQPWAWLIGFCLIAVLSGVAAGLIVYFARGKKPETPSSNQSAPQGAPGAQGPAELQGTLLVRAPAGSEIFIDDEKAGTVGAGGEFSTPALQGTRNVRVAVPNTRLWIKDARVTAKQTVSLAFEAPRPAAVSNLAPDARRRKAAELLRKKDFAAAEAEYRELTKADAGDTTAHLGLGRALEQQKRYGEAITEFETVLRGDENNVEALRALSRLYAFKGRDADAETVMRRLLKNAPPNVPVHQPLARLLARSNGKLDEALSEINLALERRQEAEFLDTKALILLARGSLEEALTTARSAVEKDRERNPAYLATMAVILHRLGRTDEAVTSYKRIRQTDRAGEWGDLKRLEIERIYSKQVLESLADLIIRTN